MTHPTPQKLAELNLGLLGAQETETIAAHIDECPTCQTVLVGLGGAGADPIVQGLRVAPVDGYADEPQRSSALRLALELQAGQLIEPSSSPTGARSIEIGNQSPDLIGEVYGEYEILEQIGAGGMGQVFKARHRRMKRVVALKILPHAAVKTAESVQRFHREVEAAARLLHRNIVVAYDAGEARGVHFLVMEYVEGQDLSTMVKKYGPLPIAHAVEYCLQAARGLAYAHAQGIIHRDIKPSNLLVDKQGAVKILDMGLAQLEKTEVAGLGTIVEENAELTHSGQIMGTADYMSPEQAFDPRSVEPRSDVYGLGCTIYRLLTGSAPYGGDTVMKRIAAHRDQPIPSLLEARPEVPKPLDALFRSMVAKKPDDRPTIAALIEELTKLTAQLHAAKQIAAGERSVLKTRMFAAIAGAVAIVMALGIWVIIKNNRGEETARIKLPAAGSAVFQQEPDTPASTFDAPIVPPAIVAVAPFNAEQARAHQEAWAKHLGVDIESTNSIGMRMILIPPGEFLMGSTEEEVAAMLGSIPDPQIPGKKEELTNQEIPRRRVKLTKPYLIGATEVTIEQFKTFADATGYKTELEQTGSKESYLKHEWFTVYSDYPAGSITWSDAVAFCKWLSEKERLPPPYGGTFSMDTRGWTVLAGDGYRLPTEAQWEFANRAGTTTTYFFGDDPSNLSQYAWYKNWDENPAKRSRLQLNPVGKKMPNAFGLFDTYGNVAEWCQDWYDVNAYRTSSSIDPLGPPSGSSARVIRGGHYGSLRAECRSGARDASMPHARLPLYGFRVVRVLDPALPSSNVETPGAARVRP